MLGLNLKKKQMENIYKILKVFVISKKNKKNS